MRNRTALLCTPPGVQITSKVSLGKNWGGRAIAFMQYAGQHRGHRMYRLYLITVSGYYVPHPSIVAREDIPELLPSPVALWPDESTVPSHIARQRTRLGFIKGQEPEMPVYTRPAAMKRAASKRKTGPRKKADRWTRRR